MAKDSSYYVRIDDELLKSIKAKQREESKEHPGHRVTMSDVMRDAIIHGLGIKKDNEDE